MLSALVRPRPWPLGGSFLLNSAMIAAISCILNSPMQNMGAMRFLKIVSLMTLMRVVCVFRAMLYLGSTSSAQFSSSS